MCLSCLTWDLSLLESSLISAVRSRVISGSVVEGFVLSLRSCRAMSRLAWWVVQVSGVMNDLVGVCCFERGMEEVTA